MSICSEFLSQSLLYKLSSKKRYAVLCSLSYYQNLRVDLNSTFRDFVFSSQLNYKLFEEQTVFCSIMHPFTLFSKIFVCHWFSHLANIYWIPTMCQAPCQAQRDRTEQDTGWKINIWHIIGTHKMSDWVNGWMDRQMGRQMNGWINEWILYHKAKEQSQEKWNNHLSYLIINIIKVKDTSL